MDAAGGVERSGWLPVAAFVNPFSAARRIDLAILVKLDHLVLQVESVAHAAARRIEENVIL